jgi:hypothetical protein
VFSISPLVSAPKNRIAPKARGDAAKLSSKHAKRDSVSQSISKTPSSPKSRLVSNAVPRPLAQSM